MKLKVILPIIAILLLTFACVQNVKNNLVFFGKNESLDGNDYLYILSKEDILYAEKKIGTDSTPLIILYLKERSIKKMSIFTEKLTGKSLTIKFNDFILYNKIPVNSKITSDTILIPINDEKLADDILYQYNKK